jgi:hypothetical protein
MMDCSKDFNEENSEPEQHHAGTDDGQDDETKQDDSKGRKTNKQSHVDVDVFHLQFWLSLVHDYHYFYHRVSL